MLYGAGSSNTEPLLSSWFRAYHFMRDDVGYVELPIPPPPLPSDLFPLSRLTRRNLWRVRRFNYSAIGSTAALAQYANGALVSRAWCVVLCAS
jgi:hypothetical protein